MARPPSIVTFERCYLGAWIVGWLVTILNWHGIMAAMQANPAITQLGEGFAPTVTIIMLALGSVITLILWYFVARRGAVAAKWIVVVLYAFALIGFLVGLRSTISSIGLATGLGALAILLRGVAVYMLFRPDAKAWFGENAVERAA